MQLCCVSRQRPGRPGGSFSRQASGGAVASAPGLLLLLFFPSLVKPLSNTTAVNPASFVSPFTSPFLGCKFVGSRGSGKKAYLWLFRLQKLLWQL